MTAMRIIVEPEVLRGVSRQLRSAAEHLHHIQYELHRTVNSLMWESSVKSEIMYEWSRASRLADQIKEQLSELGQHVQAKAIQFEEIDNQASSILVHDSHSRSPAAMYMGMELGANALLLPKATAGIFTSVSNPRTAIQALGNPYYLGREQEQVHTAAHVQHMESNDPVFANGWTFVDPRYAGRTRDSVV
ncbi:WXG100 family type VII secretion target [Paenibacillus sp. 481]|uniref:WXG100 family type VII secretion target n=1 Tax=Paenibacillus sp. 481 TaxID=2835869 RepID=UPI001E3615B3|nr:WXG100 family type VII secretion target [Paenibacillus sp. 481]UHA73839.1 hypothetical protein KIK04_01320 [Paenibacillus sp. 481]